MKRKRYLAITIIFALLVSLLSACKSNKPAETTGPTAAASETTKVTECPFLQENLDLAAEDELIWFQGGFEWDWHSKKSGVSLYYMTVACSYNPYLKASNGTLLADRILEHFRNLISGGKEPGCSGNGLNAQGYNPTLHAIAVASRIPEIWNRLTDEEKGKLQLIAKAALIGAMWCYDDENDFPTGLDQKGNFGKMWNPNYREGGVGAAIAATYILGGAGPANEVLTGFDYDSFLKELEQAGFMNIVSVFDKTEKAAMEAAVKNTFTYFGHGLDEPFQFVKALAENSWSKPVKAATSGEEGYILSGKETLPNVGYIGMGAEFDSQDANGVRSSAVYVTEAWVNSIINRCTVQLMGDWGEGPEQREVEARMYIGTEDLLYKLMHGYHDYSKGESMGVVYAKDIKFTHLPLLKELWNKTINKLDSIPSDYKLIAEPEPEGPEKTAKAIKGTPVIDGKMDALYEKTDILSIDRILVNANPAYSPATGEARVLWDDKCIYVYAEIKDKILNKDPSQKEWDCDNLEIFLDEGNERTEEYDDNDIQLRIDIENVITCNNVEYIKAVKSQVVITDTGYIIEAALPLQKGCTRGQVIGFDLMINDDTGGNKSSAAIGWTKSPNKYLSTKKFGELVFEE